MSYSFCMLGSTRLQAFVDEFEKIAAQVPFIHGTTGAWKSLQAAVGQPILRNDPNARAIYTAMKSRKKLPGIEAFARAAQKARGGEALVAHGKMDTKKGWKPFGLTQWGKENLDGIEDAHALAASLDTLPDKASRGKVWRKLHQAVGAWRNEDLTAGLRPTHYEPAT